MSWSRVFTLIASFEDALTIQLLFEYREKELLANGESLSVILGGALPSERSLAGALADRMNQSDIGKHAWTYFEFYTTREYEEITRAQMSSFVDRCRDAGIVLAYDDRSTASDEIAKHRRMEPA